MNSTNQSIKRPMPLYEYPQLISLDDFEGDLWRNAILHDLHPFYLCKFLKRLDNGVVILDKQRIIEDYKKENEVTCLLGQYYLVGWKEEITLCFEPREDIIIVGGYNLLTGEISQRYKRISTHRLDNPFSYTYSKRDFERLKSIIEQT